MPLQNDMGSAKWKRINTAKIIAELNYGSGREGSAVIEITTNAISEGWTTMNVMFLPIDQAIL
jgi:hypothetical protein